MSENKTLEEEIGIIVESIYESGEYHARAKSNATYKKYDVFKATNDIFSLVVARLEEEKHGLLPLSNRPGFSCIKCDIHFKSGNCPHNQTVDDCIQAIRGK